MDRIFGALQVVDNNADDRIGGGGTPLQPLAPPITAGPDADGDGVADDEDNCPGTPNPDQLNTDSGPQPPYGHIGIWGNGPDIDHTKHTIPNGDSLGDACDTDHDNDGLANAVDLDPIGASGPCAAFAGSSGGHAQPAAGDPTSADGHGPSWDTDGDQVPDGAECALGTDPRQPSQGDRSVCANSLASGGLEDADADGLLNAWEFCKWGTEFASAHTDDDGLKDCVEALDINGNHIVTQADAVFVLRAAFQLTIGDWTFDVNGNGSTNNIDAVLLKQAVFGYTPCLQP
jgi:hypothetical protein